MKPLLRLLIRIYEFFAGDPVLLVAVATAFGAGVLLSRRLHEEHLLLIATLVGVIVIGIVTTIGRELGAAFPQRVTPAPEVQREGIRQGERRDTRTGKPRGGAAAD